MRKHNLRYILAVVVLVFALAFTGCSSIISSPKETMRAPYATGEYQKIQSALINSVGNDVILKYPSSGSNRSAFFVDDLDHDGLTEAIAFYQKSSNDSMVNMGLIRNAEGEWYLAQELNSLGSDISKIEASDLDGDLKKEVITGWEVTASILNKMFVFNFDTNGQWVQTASESYTDFVIADISNTGTNSIGILTHDKVNKLSTMEFYNFSQNLTSSFGSVVFDGAVLSYASFEVSKLHDGRTIIYADAYKDANSMITEAVYFDNGKFVNPFYNTDTHSTTSTLRYSTLHATDIDEDGYIEIPVSQIMSGYESVELTEKQYITNWVMYEPTETVIKASCWYVEPLGFFYKLKNMPTNRFTASYDKTSNMVVFSKWDPENFKAQDELFRIKRFTKNAWQTEAKQNYSVLVETDEFVWAAMIPTGSNVTIEEIKSNFNLIYR